MSASQRSATPRNLPSLTSLRTFAALGVFGFHAAGLLAMFGTGHLGHAAGKAFAGGPTGVSFFFILSGFVLTWSRRSVVSATRFWRQRAARILPAYVLAWILGYAVLAGLGHTPPLSGAAASLFLVQVWTSNPDVLFAVNIVAWSLAVEAVFYLLFPVVLRGLLRLSPRSRPRVMAGLAFVPLTLALIQHLGHGSGGYLWLVAYFPLARLPEFLIGALLALELRDGRWRRIPLLPAAVLALGAYLVAGQVPQAFMWVCVTLVPYTLLVAAAAQSDLAGSPSWLRERWTVSLGLWSYAFYLIQVPIGLVVAHYWHPLYRSPVAQVAVFAGYLALVWAAGALVYRFVEHPLHARFSKPATRPSPEPAHEITLPLATPTFEQATP